MKWGTCLGSYSYKVGYVKRGVWYEPTGTGGASIIHGFEAWAPNLGPYLPSSLFGRGLKYGP